MDKTLDGSDLILSVGGNALAWASECKVSTKAETGERTTKETASGKWGEKYVKKFSESISANGTVLISHEGKGDTYDTLRAAMLKGEAIDGSYSTREGTTREGSTTKGYSGKYIITSLELEGKAGDDATYSVSLENSGAVSPVGNGLQDADV